MSNEIKNKIVPRLRFPEFSNSGEWEENQLGLIGEFIGGGTPDTLKSEYWDGKIQWFTPSEIKKRYVSKSIRTISEDGLRNSSAKLLPEGTLLITTRATIGEIGIAKNQCTTNQGFQSLIVSDSNVNIFWYFWITQHKIELIRKASGSTFPEIGKNEIKKIKVLRPEKEEQQKIADCLSSLDDLITAQKQKLEALKAYKKGLMQKLFPSEGKTVPQLRFAEFRESGNWEEKKLGDIGKFTGGGTPIRINEDFWRGDIPWISSSDLQDDSIKAIKINRFITESALQQSATKLVPKNSILLVSRVGVGKLAISRNAICTSQDFTNFTPANDDLVFLAYYLKLISNVLLSFSQGMAIMGFTKDDISRLELMLPTLQEQQKIANCLSSLDDLITAQKEKIEALKVHKKGLMQQLFPNINE